MQTRIAGLVAVIGLVACGVDTQSTVSLTPNAEVEIRLPGNWKEGVHYEIIDPSLSRAADGKLQIVEFFWYGCPHCYTLEPHLVLWSRTRPKHTSFLRVHATWRAEMRAHARLFYVLHALGREDLDSDVMEEIHRHGNRLFSKDGEEQTYRLQVAFASRHGIAPAAFRQMYSSEIIDTKMGEAEEFAKRWHVDGVPSIVIGGKYKTSYARAGDESRVIALLNDIMAYESATQLR